MPGKIRAADVVGMGVIVRVPVGVALGVTVDVRVGVEVGVRVASVVKTWANATSSRDPEAKETYAVCGPQPT